MKISSLPKREIYEVNFGYHSKMGGYTTLMSDIPKLDEIVAKRRTIRWKPQKRL